MISPADLAQILAYVQAQLPAASVGEGFPDVVATVFQAADFIINGNGAFFYSGPPAAGNLALSVTGPAGGAADSFGNAVLAGTAAYVPPGSAATAIQMSGGRLVYWTAPTQAGPYTIYQSFDGTNFSSAINAAQMQALVLQLDNVAPPVAAAGTAELFASGSQLKYVAGATGDGNAYSTGRLRVWAAGGQLINVAADTPITGLTAAVAAGTYGFYSLVAVLHNQSAGTASIAAHGPAVSGGGGGFWHTVGGQIACNWTSTGLPHGGQGMTAGATGHMHLEGTVTFSAAGTFTVQASTSLAADTFTIDAGSFLDLWPVT